MAKSTGIVLAAGGLALANEMLFAPIAGGGAPSFSSINWRILPATGILALTLAGLEKVASNFAVGLAGLVFLAVLIIPVGKARSPIENVAKTVQKG